MISTAAIFCWSLLFYNLIIVSAQGRSCPTLPSPKPGGWNCSSSRQCRGYCMVGYEFEGQNSREMTLECRNGQWTPFSQFPACISLGHCRLDFTGAGSQNCSMEPRRGTSCAIWCSGQYAGTFLCTSGTSWTPSLPWCVRPKAIPSGSAQPEYQPECRCQAGGTCDVTTGSCTCPSGRTGRYCEQEARRYCPDPGTPRSGARRRGNSPNQSSPSSAFVDGDTLEFFCVRDGTVLRGDQTIRCRSDGSWTAAIPSCQRRPTPAPVICQDPGWVENADRLNVDGSPSGSAQRYTIGQSVRYRCRDGYSLLGPPLLTCLNTGQWTEAERPFCVAEPNQNGRTCPTPRLSAGVTMVNPPPASASGFEVDTELLFRCTLSNSRLLGAESIYCKEDGEWSEATPTCSRGGRAGVPTSPDDEMSCTKPAASERLHFKVVPAPGRAAVPEDAQDVPPLTYLQYECAPGYRIQGNQGSTVICELSGQWSGRAPVCIEDCGRSPLSLSSGRISHGNRTKPGDLPWMVAVHQSNRGVVCGGALLDSRTALTAAHCFEAPSATFTLYFGKYYRSNARDDALVQNRTSFQYQSYPRYNRTTHEGDIAVVRFDPPVTYSDRVIPVCLPDARETADHLREGQIGLAAGWGTNQNGLLSNELMMANLTYVSDDGCRRTYENLDNPQIVGHGHFCMGPINPTPDENGLVAITCRGDSGSPLVFLNQDSRRFSVEGLVNFGLDGQCGFGGAPSVFTKVSTFLDWVYRIKNAP